MYLQFFTEYIHWHHKNTAINYAAKKGNELLSIYYYLLFIEDKTLEIERQVAVWQTTSDKSKIGTTCFQVVCETPLV